MTKPEAQPTNEVATVLVANHRDFLAFVERRVGDRVLAEEIVQDALVRSLEHAGEIRESPRAIATDRGLVRRGAVVSAGGAGGAAAACRGRRG